MKHLPLYILLLFNSLTSFCQTHLSPKTVFYLEELSPMPEPVSNNAAICVYLDGEQSLYSFGGIDSTKIYSGIHNRCWKYDVASDTWSTLPSMPDSLGRIAAGVSVIDTVAYIIGGYHVFEDGQELSFDDVFRFDLKNDVWLENGTPIPVKIDDHVQITYKDSLIYVVTGWSGSGFSGTNVANVQIYDPANNVWSVGTPVPNTNQYKAFGASGAIIEDTIYYFGGAKISGFSFLPANELRKGAINPDDPTTIEWSVITTDHTAYRALAWPFNELTPGEPQDFIHWMGGSANTYNYNGIAYDGSGGVPPRDSSLIYGRFQNTFEQFVGCISEFIDRMDLRTSVNSWNMDYIIVAGGMEADQQVTARTTKILATFCSNIDSEELVINLSVYPSPSAGRISWEHLFNEPVQWIIFDIAMQRHASLFSETAGTLNKDLSELPSGTYILCAINENGSLLQSAKFVLN